MRIREITRGEAIRLFTENPGTTIFMTKKVGALTTLGELRMSDGFMIVEDDEPEKEPEPEIEPDKSDENSPVAKDDEKEDSEKVGELVFSEEWPLKEEQPKKTVGGVKSSTTGKSAHCSRLDGLLRKSQMK